MSDKLNSETKTGKNIDLSRFKPEDLLQESDGSLYDTSIAISPIARLAIDLINRGVHYDRKHKQYRIYDPGKGLWIKVTEETMMDIAAIELSKLESVNFDESKPIPKKHWLELRHKILLPYSAEEGNPMFHSWEVEPCIHLLAFNNLVLDLRSGSHVSFSKELYLESKLTRDYNPDDGDDCPNWIRLVSHIADNDEKVIDVIEAFAFLSMIGRGDIERCILFLQSDVGGSGKGTLINALQILVGRERYATSSLQRLTDDTTISDFENKTLLTFPEERESISPRSGAFKTLLKLSTKDSLSGRIVHSPTTFEFKSDAMIVIAANEMLFGTDSGMSRRMLQIHCKPPQESDVDIRLGQKIKDEMSQVTNRILNRFNFDAEAAREVILEAAKYNVFLQNAKAASDEISTVAAFLDEMVVAVCPIGKDKSLKLEGYREAEVYHDMPIAAISKMSLYKAYKTYLEENNPSAKAMKRTKFEREVELYYLSNYEKHVLYTTEDHIWGLKGSKKRFLGIMPNQIWKEEGLYNSLGQ